jgi:hypothetical protein
MVSRVFEPAGRQGTTIYIHVQDDEFYEGLGVHFVTVATDAGYGLMLQEL